MASRGDKFYVNGTAGRHCISFYYLQGQNTPEVILFYLEYVKFSYAYYRILDWAKTDKSFRSYVSTKPYEYNSYQKDQVAQKTRKGVDLLEEFDKGMKVIESWKVGDEAE